MLMTFSIMYTSYLEFRVKIFLKLFAFLFFLNNDERKLFVNHSRGNEGRKEMFYLTTHSTFMVIWRHTNGKEPHIYREGKPTAVNTWAILFD